MAHSEYVNCSFFFDESFHDPKIRISDDAILNIWREDRSHDKYVGVFVGWADDDLEDFEREYLLFENDMKSRFGSRLDAELKSSVVGPKYYEKGLASFNPKALSLYTRFFEFLLNTECIWQMNIISKIDLFWRRGLHFWHPKYGNDLVMPFSYALEKFFVFYADDALMCALMDFCNGRIKGYKFVKMLIAHLGRVIDRNKGITRKYAENKAYGNLRKFLRDCDFVSFDSTVSFDYDIDSLGLRLCLEDYTHISDDKLKIFIDAHDATFASASIYFESVFNADSKNYFGIRVADLFAGFVARMLHSISVYAFSDYIAIPISGPVSTTVPYALSEWFELHDKLEAFNLYRIIADFMMRDDLPYWTILDPVYDDEGCMLFSLLRYMQRFSNFEEYRKMPADQHCKNYNAMAYHELLEHMHRHS